MKDEMSAPKTTMTRDQLQVEAEVIEALLDAATVMHASATPEDAWNLMQMANDRVHRLVRDLDAVNAPELRAAA